MNENSKFFLNKKILIYGLGKSGNSSFKFLKKKNKVFLFDDNRGFTFKRIYKRNLISLNQIKKIKFDSIILSPGIDINNCKLKEFLKKNIKIVFTDLDVFYSFNKNLSITITGTNGKSTTCQLLYQVLKKQKLDVRLGGNIGYPILSIKNLSKKKILVIEASSYQLEYIKLFRSKYSVILNISPDHLERHKTMKRYIISKFKLIKNQDLNSFAFVNKGDKNIQNYIKKNKFKSKIIKVDTKLKKSFLNNLKNEYFLTLSNQENLSFIIEIAKKLSVHKKDLISAVRTFKGLDYRQQIVHKNKDFTIINDSKSTSYSSSIEMLKKNENIYWILGGIPKKGDRLDLSKKYFHKIKAFMFGSNKKKFFFDLKNKIRIKRFSNLEKAFYQVLQDIKNDSTKKKLILFSPAAASFDSYKNFEDRGKHFNKLIKKYLW